KLKSHYRDLKRGEIVLGYQWDYPTCPEPRKELLDAAFPDNPVVLAQFGGHGTWLNSNALKAMGIAMGKPDPPGEGVVLRDADGEPTGVVREMSSNKFISRRFFKMFFDRSMREPRVRRALEIFAGFGITSIQDNTWFYPVAMTLTKLRRLGELTSRVSCWSFGRMPWTVPLMGLPRYDKEWVRRGPHKYFLDGSFTTRTAFLWEDYVDEPGNAGQGMSEEEILRILRRLAAKGVQGAFHAIGDRAVTNFLDAVEKLQREYPQSRGLRFRLEHAQLVRPEDIPRLRDLGVIICAQASALSNPEKDIALLGERRAERAYPHRSLLDAGVPLSFGSDIPGESTCNPLESIHMVVNRTSPERISVEEALRCYTLGSAYAEFQEDEKGSLEVGKYADFAVLSQDILSNPPDRIKETTVELTVVGGRKVYDARHADRTQDAVGAGESHARR
ncbi:MAG TPA: amidohydrolase, partial [Spirochaetia bacterium]|nr:amidohydrolase [Spirochaetia bacterium]